MYAGKTFCYFNFKMAFRFLHHKNRNAAKRFGSSSAQGCGGQERMMGFGEEGEKGPFRKRAFSIFLKYRPLLGTER
jgi:hypothetical protein